MVTRLAVGGWFFAVVACSLGAAETQRLTGAVVSENGETLAARVYLQNARGDWLHVASASPEGEAIEYNVERGASVEVHTTVSPHGFVADLEPGKYTVTIERGKEYRSLTRQIEIGEEDVAEKFELKRFVNMAERGWYSGETHVHRKLAELPLLIQAEDLNVAFPLTYWVTDSEQTPSTGNKSTDPKPAAKLIRVDRSHVIWPVNTEYEIFTVRGERHTLGAVFVLNHRDVMRLKTPPVKGVAEFARSQHALLDLDKHNWPWSMTIAPLMNVQLFELTNNHIWRTDFLFKNWYVEYAPEFMEIERDDQGGFTERGWVDFGFQTWYALLNCGFNIRPSGGTASGVHPVPLGFGRVYVHLPDGFDYDQWVKQLEAGRSFVTTGPLLDARFNSQPPGARIQVDYRTDFSAKLSGTIDSEHPIARIDIVVNGEVAQSIKPQQQKTDSGYRTPFEAAVKIEGQSWIAVRCFEALPDSNRFRFAHTAAAYYEVQGQPLRPRKVEVDYLIERVQAELKRHANTLSEESLNEHREALKYYEKLRSTARD